LDLLGKVGLNQEQIFTLEKAKEDFNSATRIKSQEDLIREIQKRKNELQTRIDQLREKQAHRELNQAERDELKQKEELLAHLTEMENQLSQQSLSDQKPKRILEKAPTLIKYFGFGLVAIFFFLIFRGLTSEMGGQKGGMMG